MNIDETRQPRTVNLASRNAPAANTYEARLYRSPGGQAFRPLWQNQHAPQVFTAELEPLEVVLVELSRTSLRTESGCRSPRP